MTDRLSLAHAFEDAGIDRAKAEHIADVVFDAVRENTATKADVEKLGLQMEGKFTELEGKLRDAVQQLTLRGFFAAVSLFFALLAALHYWPPH